MAVSPFDRLRSGRTRIDKQLMGSTASTIITQKPTVATEKIAARRTRDSVRRASDFVQIPITLKMPEQGPAQKPYASDNRKPLNCMAQEFSTSGAHKQTFLGGLGSLAAVERFVERRPQLAQISGSHQRGEPCYQCR